MSNFFTFYDKTLGEVKVNFRHDFDGHVTNLHLSDGSVLVVEPDGWDEATVSDVELIIANLVDGGLANFPAENLVRVSQSVPGKDKVIGMTFCEIETSKFGFFSDVAECVRGDNFSRRLGRMISFVRTFYAVSEEMKENGAALGRSAGGDIMRAFIARNYRRDVGPDATGDDIVALIPEWELVSQVIFSMLNPPQVAVKTDTKSLAPTPDALVAQLLALFAAEANRR